jgi:hypothetical protein
MLHVLITYSSLCEWHNIKRKVSTIHKNKVCKILQSLVTSPLHHPQHFVYKQFLSTLFLQTRHKDYEAADQTAIIPLLLKIKDKRLRLLSQNKRLLALTSYLYTFTLHFNIVLSFTWRGTLISCFQFNTLLLLSRSHACYIYCSANYVFKLPYLTTWMPLAHHNTCSVISGFWSRLVDLGVVGNGALSVARFWVSLVLC